jgi:NTP pyrophosphatase (non-canonical NTP hydrolase)
MKISEFQELMKTLFFHQDSKRGIEKTFLWLVEEIGELSNALRKSAPNTSEVADELADVVAWTCSLANLMDIDMEKALYEKYPNKCLKCNSNPCKCGKKK